MRLGPPGPVPPGVMGLLAVSFAAYIAQRLIGRGFTEAFALYPSEVLYELEVWRLATYLFLHGGVMHLALNCLLLWMFGCELEQRWGRRFFLKYYFVCGAGAGLFFTLVRATTMAPTVGASGAIYGVLMAYGMWFPNREVLLFLTFPVRVRSLIVFLIALEFLQTLESSGDGIAHAAHLGGMAFGYLYLRWWGAGGLGLPSLGDWGDFRRRYHRWRFRRLQKRRLRDRRTLH